MQRNDINDAYKLMHEGVLALGRAEINGMRIDMQYIHKTKRRLTYQINQILKELDSFEFVKDWKRMFGGNFNINSGHQMRELLYKHYKLKASKNTEKGYGSTDEETLLQLDIEGIDKYIRMKKLIKIRDVYLLAFEREQVDGYVHPFFNLHTVVTFRSSSDHPNFQNIPKRDKEAMQIVRKAIYARPGHMLLEMDFSKLEVSISACYHKDPVMLNYLKSEHNDMHGDLAKQIFKLDKFDKHIPEYGYLRSAAKNGFIFPQFYGDYYVGNAESLRQWIKLPAGRWKPGQGVKMPNGGSISDHMLKSGISSQNQFIKHLQDVEYDFWNRRFKVYQQWKERWLNAYKKKGYFYSLTGFKYSGIMRKNAVINYPVQGAAFHCLLWVFIELDRWLRKYNMDTRLIGQIHDAVVVDVNPAEFNDVYDKIRELAIIALPEHWKWIIAPLDIAGEVTPVDGSWAEKSDYVP